MKESQHDDEPCRGPGRCAKCDRELAAAIAEQMEAEREEICKTKQH